MHVVRCQIRRHGGGAQILLLYLRYYVAISIVCLSRERRQVRELVINAVPSAMVESFLVKNRNHSAEVDRRLATRRGINIYIMTPHHRKGIFLKRVGNALNIILHLRTKHHRHSGCQQCKCKNISLHHLCYAFFFKTIFRELISSSSVQNF